MTATPKPRAGEHTKGPWYYTASEAAIRGEDGWYIASLGARKDEMRLQADARRIVAAVNALEGWPTEALEMVIPGSFFTAIGAQAERDALREALSIIAGEPRQDDTYAGMDKVQIARSALAKHGR